MNSYQMFSQGCQVPKNKKGQMLPLVASKRQNSQPNPFILGKLLKGQMATQCCQYFFPPTFFPTTRSEYLLCRIHIRGIADGIWTFKALKNWNSLWCRTFIWYWYLNFYPFTLQHAFSFRCIYVTWNVTSFGTAMHIV